MPPRRHYNPKTHKHPQTGSFPAKYYLCCRGIDTRSILINTAFSLGFHSLFTILSAWSINGKHLKLQLRARGEDLSVCLSFTSKMLQRFGETNIDTHHPNIGPQKASCHFTQPELSSTCLSLEGEKKKKKKLSY